MNVIYLFFYIYIPNKISRKLEKNVNEGIRSQIWKQSAVVMMATEDS